MALISVANLKIDFHTARGAVEAVRGISFEIQENEAVAIVGESGSGKSVTALSLARLLPSAPVCEIRGEARYDGKNLLELGQDEIRAYRGKHLAYIFQEPSTSLNPVLTIGFQIAEAIRLHRPDVKDVEAEIVHLLEQVGIREAASRVESYPHQLSGGMQQRVMIAMALACQPRLLIADEPTTALDVTIQAQIMDLLKELRRTQKMSILLITHNFGIVADFADRVIVMFRGKVVESGATRDVLYHPQHPYTKALISCIPRLWQRQERLTTIDYATLE